MNALKRLTPWLLVAAAAFAPYYWHDRSVNQSLNVADAISGGKIEVQLAASGADGNKVTMTLVRPAGVTGTVKVVIPSGTVLYGAATQRLVVALQVSVVLSDETPSITQEVKTYCLDEFATTPSDGYPLAFAPPPGVGSETSEETEPLHKLADCLAGSSLSEPDRQLAVWALAGGQLQKTHDEAVQFVTDGLAEQMATERHAQLVAKKPDLRRIAPTLSNERLDEQIEAEFKEGMPELHDIASAKAREQVDSFVGHDKDTLSSCGYETSSMAIFQ
jgi:hypothetical protein